MRSGSVWILNQFLLMYPLELKITNIIKYYENTLNLFSWLHNNCFLISFYFQSDNEQISISERQHSLSNQFTWCRKHTNPPHTMLNVGSIDSEKKLIMRN